MLNIATQDIINSIIKIEDPLEDLEAIKAIEEEEEDLEEKDIFISKLIILNLL
jgi:hypothetical protein